MITGHHQDYKVLKSPSLNELLDKLKTGKWRLVELRRGAVNKMKVIKKG